MAKFTKPASQDTTQEATPRSRWQEQNRMLVRLARQQHLHQGDFTSALQEITRTAATTLGVERTSIWLYNPERDQIHCLELYERHCDRHSQGSELFASLYPAYFRALEQERTIAADDALHDSRTQEFGSGYLTPLGITALLDAPIWLAGQMVGVVCHEHVGEIRHWTVEEQQFAASIADLVSVTLEAQERLQTEAALRLSEERLQSFFNATFEAVVIHDQGRILDVNHAAETIFGYTAAEMIGMTTLQLAPPEMHKLLIERTLHPQGGILEATGLRRDGSTFIGELSTKAISYQGQPAQVVSIRDITKRKQAEAALEALNASLEEQVAERTAQLQQQMQELQELNHLRDVFLHAVSHDLRTPVMGSLLVLNNLLQTPSTEDGNAASPTPPAVLSVPRTTVARMVASCERQQALIDSLLETHASEASGLHLHLQPTHFPTLVNQILADLEPLLVKNQATVENRIPPELPLLPLDAPQLQRVYENLITNALKHNPPGLTLILSARLEPEIHGLVCTIQDNGVGISPDQTTKLFDLYFRGSSARHRRGIGLGLYLCRQIVEAHGGQIGVQSQPGSGATFWLQLPLSEITPE